MDDLIDTKLRQIEGCTSLLVSVDMGVGASSRVKYAASLAAQCDARLIGIAAESPATPVYGEGDGMAVAAFMEMEDARLSEDLADAEQLFRRAVGPYKNIEWRSKMAPAVDFVAEMACLADVLIVSGLEDTPSPMAADARDLVMQVGRPILLVPIAGPDIFRLNHILIAWKNTREARRAVADALPFIKAANKVRVASFGEDDRDSNVEDVATFLERHGVQAQLYTSVTSGSDVAKQISDLAVEEAADLIVCGAYGHSRTKEWIFGGVTKELMRSCPVPWFMSH
jgi:nucleotide-binding universal stress UspA family protein